MFSHLGRREFISFNLTDQMNAEKRRENKLEWYVMKCRKAADVAANIDATIDGYEKNGSAIPEQNRIVSYFIPAKTIERQTVTKSDANVQQTQVERFRQEAALHSNAIRNTLRNFVFLQIRPSGLAVLAEESWNGEAKRIFHYRDYSGEEVTVTKKMMSCFMEACMEFGSKLEICTVQDKQKNEITQGITVTVREGAFAGLEAEVVSLQYKTEGLRFTIAVKLFSNGSYAYVHDRKPEDVIIPDKESYVFNTNFIDRIEDSLLTILKRRVKRKESPEEMEDNNQLIRSYYQLHNARIEKKDLAVRYDAIMSICASMLKSSSAKSKYAKLMKRRMKEVRQQPTDYVNSSRCLAYLLSALFLCTKDPVYRDELKTILQAPPLATDILQRHLVILRWLK